MWHQEDDPQVLAPTEQVCGGNGIGWLQGFVKTENVDYLCKKNVLQCSIREEAEK